MNDIFEILVLLILYSLILVAGVQLLMFIFKKQ
jgi:hypothetical protein